MHLPVFSTILSRIEGFLGKDYELYALSHNPTVLILIITITIFSNLIGALTALFFTNYWVGLKSDSWLKPDT